MAERPLAVEVRMREQELRGWGGRSVGLYLWRDWKKEGIVLCVRWVRAGDLSHTLLPPRVALTLSSSVPPSGSGCVCLVTLFAFHLR